ncbi:GNAT family N-acetyltransferase [Butyrivibrio sp. NC2002]|uniref:GNAT family N-acetyltransferase n=1 Tax=Butyrivibrio sp. NC2002 TaxID=1410610 RepID=UPI0009DEE72F|nr:GNAT family N-acetyltransferase [Butyrivibrio sp. NC2002]
MITVRKAKLNDAGRLLEIYAYYITDTAITFEEEIPSLEEFENRIKTISNEHPYIVLEDDGEIYGYAYASSFVGRSAYGKSCELTIYLDKDARKKGYGRILYSELEKELKELGYTNMYACIGDPIFEDKYLTKNSERFHEHLGFTKIGSFYKCGRKFGNWYNMIWMEKIIADHNMKSERINIWKDGEYNYPYAFGFEPNMVSYLHDDDAKHPCMIVVPGGGYYIVSPTEAKIVADRFYKMGYNTFVVTYTTNLLWKEPLKDLPMEDLSRAIRLVRANADSYGIDENKVYVCGFSAGAHLVGSVCVHFDDIKDPDDQLENISNRPDAAILSYPVITSGEFAHRESFDALVGSDASKEELDYYSLEKQVTKDTPPTFLWHTATDETVPVENSYLYESALRKNGVLYALHVFSKGHHGLSLGNANWARHEFGDPYTYEQVFKTMEAIKNKEVEVSKEKEEELIRDYGEVKYVPDVTYPEIKLWPELADDFLKNM